MTGTGTLKGVCLKCCKELVINTIYQFCHNATAVKLWQYFDALIKVQNEFASANLHHQD